MAQKYLGKSLFCTFRTTIHPCQKGSSFTENVNKIVHENLAPIHLIIGGCFKINVKVAKIYRKPHKNLSYHGEYFFEFFSFWGVKMLTLIQLTASY